MLKLPDAVVILPAAASICTPAFPALAVLAHVPMRVIVPAPVVDILHSLHRLKFPDFAQMQGLRQ